MTTGLKLYRRHRCDRRHRTPATFMRCALPGAAWIDGEGEWALIAWCRAPTVTLWPDQASALDALGRLGACGGFCQRRHEVVHVIME